MQTNRTEIITNAINPADSLNKPIFAPASNNNISVLKSRLENQFLQTRNVASMGTVVAIGRSLASSIARDIADTTGNERLISGTSNALRGLALGTAIYASKGTAAVPIVILGVADLIIRERQRERNNQARVFDNRLRGARISSRNLPGAFYD